jgi:AsmA protein
VRSMLLGLAAIAVIGAIIAFVGPLLISTEVLRDKLLAQVEAATGYRLRASGPVQISFFPSLDLVAEDVGIAKSATGAAAEMATAKTLRFSLTLSELLSGKVKVTEVTLIDPVIALPEAGAGTKTGAEQGNGAASGEESAANALQSLSLDKLVIKNGTVILPPSDGSAGKRIEALTLEASLPSYDDPLSLDIKAVLEGQNLHVAGSIGGFGHFLEGAAAPVSAAIEAPAYSGEKIELVGTSSYQGDTLTFSQFTARAGDKSLVGNATYKASVLTLNPITATSGANTLSGAVAVNLAGAVPYLAASLTGKTLDLDALLARPGAAQSSAGVGGGDSGWSDAKIDFSPLRTINAKLQLSVAQLIYNKIRLSSIGINATLIGGKLTVQIPNLKLYDGGGTAALAIDASGKTPTQAIKLSLANLDAYGFLKTVAGFESIEGTGAIALDLTASGASQRAIVSALNGTAKLEFTDGAIRGINLAKTVRSLTTGIVSGWQESSAEKTDFAALGASSTIAKGQAQTQDLHLAGPLVRMTGAGTIDLPGQTLKLRVDPQVVASLEGQGGKADLQGLGVPVIIAGPWGRPSIYPDIEGILKDPVAAYQQLNKLGGGLVSLSGNVGDKFGSNGSGAGALIENGKINKSALQQGAIKGLGQLLGNQPAAEQAPLAEQEPAGQAPQAPKAKQKSSSDAPPTEGKTGKKRPAAKADGRPDPALAPEAAAKQLMLNFLGN